MRILHVVQYFSPGGLEKFVWNLSLAQKKLGHDVGVFVYDDKREWAILLGSLGIKVHLPPHKKAGFDKELVFRLDEVASQYDVIHSHDIGPLIYSGFVSWLKKLRGERKIFMHTVHGLVHTKHSSRYQLYEKVFTTGMEQVITVSPEIHQFYALQMGIPKKKLKLILNGVDVDDEMTVFHRALHNGERNYLRKKYNIGRDVKIILSVARIFPLKDQMTLVRAMKDLPDYVLLLVGPAHDQAYTEQILKVASNNVHLVGSRNELEEYYLGADLYASASTEEGVSISLLEAMAHGLPVLVSDIPGHRSVVKDGEVGALFKLGDSADFTAQLKELKDGQLGFQHVKENFSMEEVAGKYLKLYFA